MRLAFFGMGPSQKAALFAVQTKEKKMRVYSKAELFTLTKRELFQLYAGITTMLNALPLDVPSRPALCETLANIRCVLAKKPPGP